jgi:hypothetical protein
VRPKAQNIRIYDNKCVFEKAAEFEIPD